MLKKPYNTSERENGSSSRRSSSHTYTHNLFFLGGGASKHVHTHDRDEYATLFGGEQQESQKRQKKNKITF